MPTSSSDHRSDDTGRAVDVAVVGGGLAGLTAAVAAARAGATVVVLEARGDLGGRARSTPLGAATTNLGPHALYRHGAAHRILDGFGVAVSGSIPLGPQFARAGEGLHALPITPGAVLRTTLLRGADKLALARLLAGIGRLDPSRHDARTVVELVADLAPRPRLAELLHALVRIATYGNDPTIASGGAALRQLQLGAAGNVLYLDDGWQQLVDGLATVARRDGVVIHSGAAVDAVDERDGAGWVVRTGERSVAASAVVVATPPAVADRLCRTDGVLTKAAGPPVHAAVLDVVADRVPPRRLTLGVDRPTYASVHGPPARLVPDGMSATVCARYLHDQEDHDPDVTREELRGERRSLGIADEHVVEERYFHRLTVAGGQPLAAAGGPSGRPDVTAAARGGLFVAGDWVGPEGLLADAAVASGLAAGTGAARWQR